MNKNNIKNPFMLDNDNIKNIINNNYNERDKIEESINSSYAYNNISKNFIRSTIGKYNYIT